jgi:hypothetical protein
VLLQRHCPLRIVGGLLNVLAAIKLYRKPCLGTVEIQDVARYRMLTPEFEAQEIPVA